MKTGILTFHTAVNYGAVFQAYALATTVRSMGHDVELIDYEPEPLRLVHNLRLRDCRTPKQLLKHLLSVRQHTKRRAHFEAFVKNRIGASPRVGQFRSTADLGDRYGAVIVGSDQVWNPEITDADLAYLFPSDGGSPRRVSYAASISSHGLPEHYLAAMAQHLPGFAALSVREESAVPVVESATGLTPSVVVDPVFFLDADAWRAVAEPVDAGAPFALLYLVSSNPAAEVLAAKAAAEQGLELRVVHKQYWRKVSKARNVLDASPGQFLGLLDRAEMLFTNSFHGMALGSIFNKEVTIVLNPNKARNARMQDLAAALASDGTRPLKIEDGIVRIAPGSAGKPVLEGPTRNSREFLQNALEAPSGL